MTRFPGSSICREADISALKNVNPAIMPKYVVNYRARFDYIALISYYHSTAIARQSVGDRRRTIESR